MTLHTLFRLMVLAIGASVAACKPAIELAERDVKPPNPGPETNVDLATRLVLPVTVEQAQGLLSETGIKYFNGLATISESEYPSLFRLYPKLGAMNKSQILDLMRRDKEFANDSAERAFEKDPDFFKSKLESMTQGEKVFFAGSIEQSITRINTSQAQAMFDSVGSKMQAMGFSLPPADELQAGLMRRQLDKFMDEEIEKLPKEPSVSWKWDSGTLSSKRVTGNMESIQVYVSPTILAALAVVGGGAYLVVKALNSECGVSAMSPTPKPAKLSFLGKVEKILPDVFYLKDTCVLGVCIKTSPLQERVVSTRPVGGMKIQDGSDAASPCRIAPTTVVPAVRKS